MYILWTAVAGGWPLDGRRPARYASVAADLGLVTYQIAAAAPAQGRICRGYGPDATFTDYSIIIERIYELYII